MTICKYCGKEIKKCYNSQKHHKDCFKQKKREYYQRPEVKQKTREYMKEKYFTIKNNWESLSDEEQLRLINNKARELLAKSPTFMQSTQINHEEENSNSA